MDQRALDECIDEELSIGDYVLTGGELGALVVVDSVSRLIPGVLGSAESGEDESFTTGLLEYPQYTRPADFRGRAVPEVLLGGNHADIVAWRREQSLELTLHRRPELLETAPLDESDRATLARLRAADAAIAALKAKGVCARRADFSEADAYPKQWFAAFVPEGNRRAAKKQCFSGRRHVGWLWQAFSMDFALHQTGEEAESVREDIRGECRLYLPDEQVLLLLDEAPSADVLAGFGHYLLTDAEMYRTYVHPHRREFGPYAAKRA